MLFITIPAMIISATGMILLSIGLSRLLYLTNTLHPGKQEMITVATYIRRGAYAFLNRQYSTVALIAIFFTLILLGTFGLPMVYGFALGAILSSLSGILGMMVAVHANVLVSAQACGLGQEKNSDIMSDTAKTAVSFGAIISCIVTGLGLLALVLAIFVPGLRVIYSGGTTQYAIHIVRETTFGLALGASLVSIFGRVAGGIFTKAADVGADLVGKLEKSLPEDDPRNPATIADNVGDNVGDCAGMASDVFETFVVSIVAIGQIISYCWSHTSDVLNILFFASNILAVTSIIGLAATLCFRFKGDMVTSLYKMVLGSVITSMLAVLVLAKYSFGHLTSALKLYTSSSLISHSVTITPLSLAICAMIGYVLTLAIIAITTYYTDSSYRPVQSIAAAAVNGHATNIIYGLAVGMESTLATTAVVIVAIGYSYHLASLLGIGMAVIAMISMTMMVMTLDAYGPITDNAGGIAEMSGVDKKAREVIDELDAVGNTTKAITKGYAIGSAALCACVLILLYVVELKIPLQTLVIYNPWILIGLLIGGMIPYIFSAYNMKYVGIIGGEVVTHVREQFEKYPEILTGNMTPNYEYTVDYITKESIKAMMIPALIPVVIPVLCLVLYKSSVIYLVYAGMNIGTLVSGVCLALMLTNAGGAWDNAKKYVEKGHHGGKHSAAHAATVTGDTVGDPCKDTAGPGLNVLIKIVNLVTILIVMILNK